MPTCLYCREPTSGEESAAHALPEAIMANNLLLPRGTMCDKCNNYFSKLDSALANHPIVAFGVQAFGLPGKRRKPRVQLGCFEYRGGKSAATLSLQPSAIKDIVTSGDKPMIALQPPQGEALRRFHRSLHYVAFNLMALYRPLDELLDSTYDPVRRYIRGLSQGEIWPYCHTILAPQAIAIIDLLYIEEPLPHVILRFFNHAFAVDLFRTSALHQHLAADVLSGFVWAQIPYK